ncbi:hypothetical protein GCM10010415_00430 [Streptomyces atrovirens]
MKPWAAIRRISGGPFTRTGHAEVWSERSPSPRAPLAPNGADHVPRAAGEDQAVAETENFSLRIRVIGTPASWATFSTASIMPGGPHT